MQTIMYDIVWFCTTLYVHYLKLLTVVACKRTARYKSHSHCRCMCAVANYNAWWADLCGVYNKHRHGYGGRCHKINYNVAGPAVLTKTLKMEPEKRKQHGFCLLLWMITVAFCDGMQ